MTNKQCFCCKRELKVGDFYTMTTAFTLENGEVRYFRHKDFICAECENKKKKIKEKEKR